MMKENITTNQPVDPFAPVPKSVDERLQELADKGLITWNGKKFQPDSNAVHPRLSPNATQTAAEVVIEGRTVYTTLMQ